MTSTRRGQHLAVTDYPGTPKKTSQNVTILGMAPPVSGVSQPGTGPRAATATVTAVAAIATNATLLALNANRLGATIYNTAPGTLFLKLGATASASSFTVKLTADDYYEVPAGYTGRIDGIWSAAGGGSAFVTELT